MNVSKGSSKIILLYTQILCAYEIPISAFKEIVVVDDIRSDNTINRSFNPHIASLLKQISSSSALQNVVLHTSELKEINNKIEAYICEIFNATLQLQILLN